MKKLEKQINLTNLYGKLTSDFNPVKFNYVSRVSPQDACNMYNVMTGKNTVILTPPKRHVSILRSVTLNRYNYKKPSPKVIKNIYIDVSKSPNRQYHTSVRYLDIIKSSVENSNEIKNSNEVNTSNEIKNSNEVNNNEIKNSNEVNNKNTKSSDEVNTDKIKNKNTVKKSVAVTREPTSEEI
jgi:hypothetical protein